MRVIPSFIWFVLRVVICALPFSSSFSEHISSTASPATHHPSPSFLPPSPPPTQQPKGRDLSRFVKWPRYVRIQRQRKILYQRLKVPPSINQFSKALEKNQATELFKMLAKYRPESKVEKRERLKQLAAAKASGGEAAAPAKQTVVKYGLKHVTELIEAKKVKFVAIAHDVNPIELVVWLPALCRKQGIPYAIVKGKARLGALVHKKNAAVVALEEAKKEDKASFEKMCGDFKIQFNDKKERVWGGGIMGLKTQKRLEIRQRAVEAEMAKKAAF